MGLPDFRSSAILWEKLAHPEIRRYENSSDNEWFVEDPEFAWGLNYIIELTCIAMPLFALDMKSYVKSLH